jgi:hypothetical protein
VRIERSANLDVICPKRRFSPREGTAIAEVLRELETVERVRFEFRAGQ